MSDLRVQHNKETQLRKRMKVALWGCSVLTDWHNCSGNIHLSRLQDSINNIEDHRRLSVHIFLFKDTHLASKWCICLGKCQRTQGTVSMQGCQIKMETNDDFEHNWVLRGTLNTSEFTALLKQSLHLCGLNSGADPFWIGSRISVWPGKPGIWKSEKKKENDLWGQLVNKLLSEMYILELRVSGINAL